MRCVPAGQVVFFFVMTTENIQAPIMILSPRISRTPKDPNNKPNGRSDIALQGSDFWCSAVSQVTTMTSLGKADRIQGNVPPHLTIGLGLDAVSQSMTVMLTILMGDGPRQ